MVASGQTGLLVSPDEPAALAGALARLLAEPEMAAAWGQRGRDHAQRYRLDAVVTQTLAVYDTLAAIRK